jgi:hypothetical protein
MHFRPEPIPDGQTIPHSADTIEVAAIWSASQRRAHLRLQLWRGMFIACCVLVPLLIVISALRHPSQ